LHPTLLPRNNWHQRWAPHLPERYRELDPHPGRILKRTLIWRPNFTMPFQISGAPTCFHPISSVAPLRPLQTDNSGVVLSRHRRLESQLCPFLLANWMVELGDHGGSHMTNAARYFLMLTSHDERWNQGQYSSAHS
jgi:hypothetical protein